MTAPLPGIGPWNPPGEWVDDAACTQSDPELWFPEKGKSNRVAKAICRQCPVAADCLDYALTIGEMSGIYGGTSAHDRRKLRGAA